VVTAAPVEASRQSVPCLNDEEILAVARLARRAEKHYRCPQDVEWALEPSGDVLLLQSRPETVWSRRARPAASCTADPITSMVQTLLNPSHSTPEGHGHG
jgi:pyruvate,water dikinase